MGKVYEAITDGVRAWVEAQPMFFVSTAPLAEDGHVNCSPRGHDALRILGPHRLAWMDLTGSGAETIAHLRENGRICVMLCAFEGAPRIMRFTGVASFTRLEALSSLHSRRHSRICLVRARSSKSRFSGFPIPAAMQCRAWK